MKIRLVGLLAGVAIIGLFGLSAFAQPGPPRGGGGGGGGSGSVTSVAISAPAQFGVSGSPVTTSGTLTFTNGPQAANSVWAGPTSGGNAVPTFRLLVPADIAGLVSLTDIQNAEGGILTTNNGSLTSGRVMLGNGARGLTVAAASGAVPINADGSATTLGQIQTLESGIFTTNNGALTSGRVMLGDGARGLTVAAASGAVSINADGSATTKGQLETLEGGLLATNNAGPLTAKVLIGNGAYGITQGTASGSVPVDADGSATTKGQMETLEGGIFTTNNGALGATSLVAGDGARGVVAVTVGSGLSLSGGTLTATGGAGFTNTATSTITFGSTITPSLTIGGLTTQCPRIVTLRCTLTGNITTVAAPTGTAVDGDVMKWEMIQDGTGNRTITGWNAIYGFAGAGIGDITGITLTTNASKRDFIAWQYNSSANVWYCTGFTRGY